MKKIVKLIICALALVIFGLVGAKMDVPFSLNASLSLGNILRAVVAILALIVVELVADLILGALKPKSHRAGTVITITQSLIKYVFGLIAVCAVLAAFGADVGTVVAGVGVLALIIGFGAESLIADLITGLFILFENQYNVGDIIEIDGFRGTVSAIGIRTTSLTDAGGNVLIVNNSNMKNVLNRSNHSSRATCVFPIPYEADLEALEKKLPDLLDGIFKAHEDVFTAAPMYLGVDELADSSVNLKFAVDVSEKDIYSAARILNRDMYIGMKKLGIEAPFPQMEVRSK